MKMENGTNPTSENSNLVYFITFIVLLVIEIVSIVCISVILIYFLLNWRRTMTKALQNHVIFLLIMVSFFYVTLDLPFNIHYYRVGYDSPRTLSFCLWWYWLDYSLLIISLTLTATASVQRHVLVFNSHLLRIRRKRWLLHYVPLIVSVVYPPIFYIIFVFFYPCQTILDDTSLVCSYPCYSNDRILFYVDWILHTITPVAIIVVANILLVCRVINLKRKIRSQRTRIWKKQKRLTSQLLAFSTLYVFGWGPSTIISIIETCFVPNLYDNRPDLYYINNSSYLVCPLQPLICVFALPELMNFLSRKLTQRTSLTNAKTSRSSQ